MTTVTTLPTVTWSSGATGAPLPPLVPGLPVLGNALSMQHDPLSFLVDCYQRYGPIFRLKALKREFTVMAGIEANQFLARRRRTLQQRTALRRLCRGDGHADLHGGHGR